LFSRKASWPAGTSSGIPPKAYSVATTSTRASKLQWSNAQASITPSDGKKSGVASNTERSPAAALVAVSITTPAASAISAGTLAAIASSAGPTTDGSGESLENCCVAAWYGAQNAGSAGSVVAARTPAAAGSAATAATTAPSAPSLGETKRLDIGDPPVWG